MIKGICYAHSDAGTEGIVWSVQDEEHISTNERGDPVWSYDGLHALKDGDVLTVFARDGSVLWEGSVSLEYTSHRAGHQCVLGFWVRGLQRGLDAELWLRMFLDELRCELRKAS